MTIHWINWNMHNYAEHGFGLWAVTFLGEDRVIGDCGLTIQMVDSVPEVEIGFHILPTFWRQGIATEAAIACRDYAFDQFNHQRVISWMSPHNLASRRVAEKIGMSFENETIDKANRPAVVYAMTLFDRQRIRLHT